MKRRLFILALLSVFISGCIEYNYQTDDSPLPTPFSIDNTHTNVSLGNKDNGLVKGTNQTNHKQTESGNIAGAQEQIIQPSMNTDKSELLIDRIALNMSNLYNKKWNSLYQEDELDCSRMSVYLWDYIRTNYHVAPKIVLSYQRQHAWLALRVSDVGNSSKYSHWNIKGMDYYYLEATIPKIVIDDNQRFLINDQSYTTAQFYNAEVYIFDTPQDANDFHAENSWSRGWNQEFRLKKADLDKIKGLLG